MSRRASWPLFAVLVTLGAFAVHQLRYLFAFGDQTSRALADTGHDYLVALEPLLGVTVALALSQALWRVVAARSGGSLPSRRSLGAMFALALFAVYSTQELVEGRLAAGDTSGLVAVLGGGGWIAVPLACVIGALLGCFVQAVEEAAESVRTAQALALPRPGFPALPVCFPRRATRATAAPLASHLAGRAPPLSTT